MRCNISATSQDAPGKTERKGFYWSEYSGALLVINSGECLIAERLLSFKTKFSTTSSSGFSILAGSKFSSRKQLKLASVYSGRGIKCALNRLYRVLVILHVIRKDKDL